MTVHRVRRVAVIVLLLGLLALQASAQGFFFRDGDDPIVFLGDSITEQHMYTTYVETYILTRFPEWKVRFRNVGWGGDTAWLARRGDFAGGLQRDILTLKPAAITIDFGMNDARGGDGTLPLYVEHQTKLVEALQAAGARVALLTPSPEERFEPDQPAGSAYNHMLWKYSEALRQVAEQPGVLWVDQYTPFVQVIEDGRRAGLPDFRLIPDAVHPNWAGHLVMAHAILRGFGAPSLVSSVEIAFAGGVLVGAQGCEVRDVRVAHGAVSFTRVDHCLPWPIPVEADAVLNVPGYDPLGELSAYTLQIRGLPAAKYELAVDGETCAAFTAEELDRGVNLTRYAGAITAQALRLRDAVLAKNWTFFGRWRQVQLFDFPAWLNTPDNQALRQQELDRLDAQVADQERAVDALRVTTPHQFTVKPVA